jgi:hypothetical protein
MLFTAKVLLTMATVGYSLIPAVVDSNKTHVTNPSWDRHARFHVVWQVSSYVYVALIAVYLIWTAGTDTRNLWLAAILAGACYGGFWTAVILRPAYDGKLISEVNPVPDIKWSVGGRTLKTDANVTAFTVFVAVLFVGLITMMLA